MLGSVKVEIFSVPCHSVCASFVLSEEINNSACNKRVANGANEDLFSHLCLLR